VVAPGWTEYQAQMSWYGPRRASHGFVVFTIDAHRRDARSLDVRLDAADTVVVFRFVDDGTHPMDAAAVADMRTYAAWLDGTVHVHTDGPAVITTARLRPAVSASGHRPPASLHLVPGPRNVFDG
jgi:hypothetical protein